MKIFIVMSQPSPAPQGWNETEYEKSFASEMSAKTYCLKKNKDTDREYYYFSDELIEDFE